MAIMSALDIAYLYIYRFYNQEPDAQEKRDIFNQVCGLLAQGWTDKDIAKTIRESTKKAPLSSLMKGRQQTAKNILTPNILYYHHELRIVPPPAPVIVQDDLIVEQPATEYYLEMRASYTMNELVDYYIDKFGVRPEDINRPRYVGTFDWFLKKPYSIDLILYMIDVTALKIVSDEKDKPTSPTELSEYVDKAREVLDAKRTEETNGKCRIIPRKRVLDFANRV